MFISCLSISLDAAQYKKITHYNLQVERAVSFSCYTSHTVRVSMYWMLSFLMNLIYNEARRRSSGDFLL